MYRYNSDYWGKYFWFLWFCLSHNTTSFFEGDAVRYDGISVSRTVTSHNKYWPLLQSRRFMCGMPADENVHWDKVLLMSVCLGIHPLLNLHDRPCRPFLLTSFPHKHLCCSQILKSSVAVGTEDEVYWMKWLTT